MRPLVVPFFIPHLGCPHRCVFCDQEKVAGATGGLPCAAEILERIREYARGAPGRELQAAFYGGTFTALAEADQERLLGALQPLIAAGALKSIRLSTRPDAVDEGRARFLAARGVTIVELGVQSLDPEVLSLSGRGHDAACVERAVLALKKAGIEVGIQLMPGLPGDAPERSLATVASALLLQPAFLRIYPTLVLSGTALAECFLAGSYLPLTLDEAVDTCKRMLLLAMRAGVDVIRMGLQPTAELESPGVLLAGPYHPAFGQLVRSELCFDLMKSLAAGLPGGSRVSFVAAPGRTSDLVGQKRGNLARLSRRFCLEVAAVREDPSLDPGTIALLWSGGSRSGRLLDLKP